MQISILAYKGPNVFCILQTRGLTESQFYGWNTLGLYKDGEDCNNGDNSLIPTYEREGLVTSG